MPGFMPVEDMVQPRTGATERQVRNAAPDDY
jgi:hypothetical protein